MLPQQGLEFGSIPAWAGETVLLLLDIDGDGVYPRVGGGNKIADGEYKEKDGLSPRGRGKLVRYAAEHSLKRSIPAWAGETGPCRGERGSERVYPRVGGGNRAMPG